MGLLAKIEAFLKGKKTYITAILIGVAAALQYMGLEIPDYVWTILAAFGIGSIRSAIASK